MIIARFSDSEKDLKIPNVYYSKEDVLNKAKQVKQNLSSNF